MTREWLYVALALLGARWWWPVLRTLRADLLRAGEGLAEDPRARRSDPRRAPAPVLATARTPLARVLAFRGVARRGAARRRWEGGFGRRGP